MYKSGDEANEKALEAMLYAEMAVQEIAEMGDTVNSMLPRMCMPICKCTLDFVSASTFHSCSPLRMRACTSLEACAENNHTERSLMARISVLCVLCFSLCVCTQEGADKIVFKKCDAYEGKNLLEMEHKGLTQFPMIFVAMDGQGMGMHTDTQTTKAKGAWGRGREGQRLIVACI